MARAGRIVDPREYLPAASLLGKQPFEIFKIVQGARRIVINLGQLNLAFGGSGLEAFG